MRSFLAVAALTLFVSSSMAFVPHSAFGARRFTNLNMALAENPKVVLITGASQGLGKAMALEIAKHGHKLIVNFYPGLEEDAQQTVDEIALAGGEGIAIAADCTKPEQVHKMFDQALDHYGKVDVVVNNAGITKDNLVPRMKAEDFKAVIDVNLSGDFYVCQGFLEAAAKTKCEGRIINIASVVGQIGNPGQCNYAASKGGVIGFTKALAKEVAGDNIKVNAICPGFIETPMTAKLTDEQLEKSIKSIPLQRLGKPEEVAAMVRFLAVDEGADYITGHCFDVDGGVGIAAA
jgi:3-oxoacyl-[acyl-carrier protein] reductase